MLKKSKERRGPCKSVRTGFCVPLSLPLLMSSACLWLSLHQARTVVVLQQSWKELYRRTSVCAVCSMLWLKKLFNGAEMQQIRHRCWNLSPPPTCSLPQPRPPLVSYSTANCCCCAVAWRSQPQPSLIAFSNRYPPDLCNPKRAPHQRRLCLQSLVFRVSFVRSFPLHNGYTGT